jgi:hypothetical protein
MTTQEFEALAAQTVRCACGYTSTWDRPTFGAVGTEDMVWQGCENPRHPGQALGAPIAPNVYEQLIAYRRADVDAVVAALANIADVHVDSEDRAHISNYAPDSEGGGTGPGSRWYERCDELIADVREELPPGWSAEWSDDDIIITRDGEG